MTIMQESRIYVQSVCVCFYMKSLLYVRDHGSRHEESRRMDDFYAIKLPLRKGMIKGTLLYVNFTIYEASISFLAYLFIISVFHNYIAESHSFQNA
jgi:hypothetical protein